uniref:ShKT domain-containing protein n=1 Tax=Ditylenchus dipsaci TaxID=166011 RepID=A0A915E6D0_9BILA
MPRFPYSAADVLPWIETNQLKASHCRFTCATCCELPEHDCEDDLAPPVQCTEENCKNVALKKYMDLYCRSTCGLCALPPLQTHLNLDPNYVDELKKNCARTCDFCDVVANTTITTNNTSTPVVNATATATKPVAQKVPRPGDNAVNCLENIDLCNNEVFRQVMKEMCAGTCANVIVKPNGVARDINDLINAIKDPDCADSSTHCATWDRLFKFCDSDFYTSASKEQECEKTCGYC